MPIETATLSLCILGDLGLVICTQGGCGDKMEGRNMMHINLSSQEQRWNLKYTK